LSYDNYLDDFERDWSSAEAYPFITPQGSILRALDDLRIPKVEIDALEHKAAAEKKSLQQMNKVYSKKD
jgi:hypothetical protein